MSFSLVPHEFTKISAGQWRVSRINPYIRLSKDGTEVFLQEGKVWDRSGKELKTKPGWFEEELAKCNPVALAEAGFKVS